MKMSIDTLIRTTKEVMAEKEIEAVAQVKEEPRSQREEAPEKTVEIRFQVKGEQPEIVVRQASVEIPGIDRVQNRRVCWSERLL
jgi:hypothetical protein